MVFCESCGVQNEEGSLFCFNCGTQQNSSPEKPAKQLSNSDAQFNSRSIDQQKPKYVNHQVQYSNQDIYQNQPPPQYNQPQYSSSYPSQNGYDQSNFSQYPLEDKINPILYILSFLFFPIGLIVFFANKQTKPQAAKNIAVVTVIGFLWWFLAI